jgi:hypothetical protein
MLEGFARPRGLMLPLNLEATALVLALQTSINSGKARPDLLMGNSILFRRFKVGCLTKP